MKSSSLSFCSQITARVLLLVALLGGLGAGEAFGACVPARLVEATSASAAVPLETKLVETSALDDTETENLVAAAKVLGIARYFYPAEHPSTLDWDSEMAAAVSGALRAGTPAELQVALDLSLERLAPCAAIGGSHDEAIRRAHERLSGVFAAPARLWVHSGLGLNDPKWRSIYKSVLTPYAPAEDPSVKMPSGNLWTELLPRGLALASPLVMPPAQPCTDRPNAPQDHRVRAASSPLSQRALQLTAIVQLWNAFRHFYPYRVISEDSWDDLLRQYLRTAATATTRSELLNAIQEFLVVMQDGHANVTHPEAMPSGRLPFAWRWLASDELIVTAVDPSCVSIAIGDKIAAINDADVSGLLRSELKRAAGATERWRRSRASQRLLIGTHDETVHLSIDRRGSPARVEVKRSLGLADRVEERRPPPLGELPEGVLYVDLTRLTDEDLDKAWEVLASADAVIFDMRGYPNVSADFIAHLTDEPVESDRWLTPVIRLPGFRDVTWQESRWTIPPAHPRILGHVVFLTDERAISASETYLGIVEHYQLAHIVGNATAGTNGNVNKIGLAGGYQVFFTGMRVDKSNGESHHGRGVWPTLRVLPSRKALEEGHDEVLEAAIHLLSGWQQPPAMAFSK